MKQIVNDHSLIFTGDLNRLFYKHYLHRSQLTIPVFTIRDPSNILVVFAVKHKKEANLYCLPFSFFSFFFYCKTKRKRFTSDHQRLAEITAQVVLAHGLHSEQVQNVRGHVGDDCFLQEEETNKQKKKLFVIQTHLPCRSDCGYSIFLKMKEHYIKQLVL